MKALMLDGPLDGELHDVAAIPPRYFTVPAPPSWPVALPTFNPTAPAPVPGTFGRYMLSPQVSGRGIPYYFWVGWDTVA